MTAPEAVWLNVGSGDRPGPPPWLNCDAWPGVRPDLLMDATARWPFADGTAGRVFMGQVVEHLPYPWGVRHALKQAWRVLGAGGQLVVICPDFLAMREKHVGAEVWRNEARGMCRWPGDAHLWLPNRTVIGRELQHRFGNVTLVNHLNLDSSWPAGSRNGWDCCAMAEKEAPPALLGG